MDVYYSATKIILRMYQRIFFQRSQNQRDIPLHPGPKIIAANHANVTDGFFLSLCFPGEAAFFLSREIYFRSHFSAGS